MGRKFPLFIYFIIGLAVVGLVTSLIKNPGSFLVSILITIAVGFVIFFIIRAILNRRSHGGDDEMRKYRKAAKRSNLKYNKQKTKIRKTTRSDSPLRPRRRRHAPHLTVIEGKKTNNKNNKNRASN